MGHEFIASAFFLLSGIFAGEYRYCDRRAKLPCIAISLALSLIGAIIVVVSHE